MSTETKSTEKVQIRIKDVLAMLEKGQDRKAIKKHYGLTTSGLKHLFNDERLKGKKVNAVPNFEIVEDEDETPTATKSAAIAPAATKEAVTPAAEEGNW